MPSVSTLGVSTNTPADERTKPSSSSVSSSRRAVGRASPAAVATSVSDLLRWSASKHVRTSSPRASASTKSGPDPRPAMRLPPSAAEDALFAAGALPLVHVVAVLVRVVEDRSLGLGHLREHALLPGLLAARAPQVLDGRLDLPAHGGEVDADELAASLHHPAVHDDGVHVTPLSLEGHVPERVQHRERHGGRVVLDQDDVGLLARLEAAEVLAPEGVRPAARRPLD